MCYQHWASHRYKLLLYKLGVMPSLLYLFGSRHCTGLMMRDRVHLSVSAFGDRVADDPFAYDTPHVALVHL